MRRAAALVLALSFAGGSAHAQKIGDTVNQHVDEHLGKPPPKKKKPKHRRPKSNDPPPSGPPPPRPPAPRSGHTIPPKRPEGPQLPHRILIRDLQLDPSVSVAYRGWKPQDYPTMDVETENTATFSIGVRAKIFRILTLHRGYYESNGISSPRRSGVSIAENASKAAPAAAWFLGMVGVPLNWVLEPILRYEARAFESEVTPQLPVRIVPHSASQNDDLSLIAPTTRPLRMTSAFETLVIGFKYHHENDPSGLISTSGGDFPPVYFGVGFTSYSKPYMVRVGNAVLDDVVFDARFRGAGLALGIEAPQKPDAFFAELTGQVGLGEVKLTHDFSLNETLPDGWLIGYAQGELTAGYLHALLRTKPTLLLGAAASIGGTTFFYFKALAEEGEDRQTPPLNWDVLWGGRVFLTLPL